MKRFASGLIFSMFVVLVAAPLCHATRDVVQLTDNAYDDGNSGFGLPDDTGYELNDDGFWVWQGWDGQDWEIFLSSGKTVNPAAMTTNTDSDQQPDLSLIHI